MALLTALLSALSRKLGSLIQAIMGWSVAALFGRLTSSKRLMVSIAMILSVLWPLFVVGVFFPAAATFVIAFIPVKDMFSAGAIRIVWIALAVLSPIVVGGLIYAAAPESRAKNIFKTVINGYPLTLGFAISFFVTLVTVPVIRLASMARRWNEEHLFVQPRAGSYAAAVEDLKEACEWAHLQPEVRPVPGPMALSTKVIKFFARGAIDSLIADDPKLIRCEGLELYLYPADLLLRGEPHKLTRVRAMMGRTMLERDAWLVEGPHAQFLQDELGRLWKALQNPRADLDILMLKLKGIVAETAKPDISYDDWVMLDRIARRLSAKLQHTSSVIDEGSLDDARRAARKENPSSQPLTELVPHAG
jgi:hypothetical protein